MCLVLTFEPTGSVLRPENRLVCGLVGGVVF